MGGFQLWHWVVIAVVGLILFFGWKQLPDMARSVGRSLRVFKTEIKGLNDDDDARDSAREKSRDDSDDAPREVAQAPQPRQIAAQQEQRPTPAAEVVRNPAVAASGEPTRTRPRPAPSPNGHAAR